MGTAIAAGAVAVLALGACGGDTPDGAEEISNYSQVGDCLQPDPGSLDRFLQADCGGDDATVEIIEMVDSAGMEPPPVCPAGTDLLVDGEQGPVVDGDIAAVAQTWCLRNLAAPHPGDPGMGGGELVLDDCFAIDARGSITEAPCDPTPGSPTAEHRLVAVADTADSCPAGAAGSDTEPIELNSAPRQVLCAEML
jgi:hypothetical protein